MIRVESKNLTQVGLAGAGQFQAIRLGARHGFFVRIDRALTKTLKATSGHEPTTFDRATTIVKNLMIDINRRIGLSKQNPLALPITKQPRRSAVAVALLVIFGLCAIKNQTHDVGRVSLIERVLHLRVNHIVGRGDNIAE